MLFALGRLTEAQELYEEVLRLSAETGDRHKVALFEGSIGKLDLDLGRPDRARKHYQRSHDLSVEVGMPREVGTALWGLGVADHETGYLENAREHLENALALFEGIAEVDSLAGVHASLAQIARAEDREADAVRHLDIALECTRSVKDPAQEVAILAARACLPGGDAGAAQRMLESVRGRVAVLTEMRALWSLFEATGKPVYAERARELLKRVQEGAPGEDRDAMVQGNRLQREIAADPAP